MSQVPPTPIEKVYKVITAGLSVAVEKFRNTIDNNPDDTICRKTWYAIDHLSSQILLTAGKPTAWLILASITQRR